MQIVIDLPNDFYERVNNDGCMSYTDAEVVVNAFYCGKVLPKGHGDLKDVNDIIRNNKRWVGYLDEDMIARLDIAVDKHVRTIVPADKEVDE